MPARPKKRRKLADTGASTVANGDTVDSPYLAHLAPQKRSTLRNRKFIDEFQNRAEDFLTLARVDISLVRICHPLDL